MKKILCKIILTGILLLLLPLSNVYAQWFIDFETGIAFGSYNDVQVPKETGTRFSLTDDFKLDKSEFFRLRLGYKHNDKHNLYLFAAPFSLEASGVVDKTIYFNEEDFSAHTPLNAKYTFNSYRLTYRYDFLRSDTWRIGIGFTAKIRDAAIEVEGGSKSTVKTNVGFVPLLNFCIERIFNDKASFIFEGDALAAPQGRAEDILLAIIYKLNDNFAIKGGYRILEGGANVKEVYNFALINYIALGTIIIF
jgi:hypothetical protein